MKSRHLQGCSPHLCRLRTDGLALWASIERTDRMLVHGPSKPISRLSTETWLFPLFHWLLWERSWIRTRRSVSRRVVDCVESPSSRGSGSVQIYWWLHERLLYIDHMRYVWSRAICGPSVKSVWRVGWVFPRRVYIDSNHLDSQIWVPLVCGSHHVDNLMNLM
jgi:hypothetical protein